MNRKLPFLETDRLILRLPEIKNAEKILKYYVENKRHFSATETLRPLNFYSLEYHRKQIFVSAKEFQNDSAVRLQASKAPETTSMTLIMALLFTGTKKFPCLSYL